MVDYIDTILQGDAIEMLKQIPDGVVQCCITSPPYYSLRDYQIEGQIGLESTPQEYISKLVQVFREVKRVLHPSGTAWINLGDSYGAHKQLLGIPWKVSFALQDDGWILRSDVVWSKRNCLPESVTDRPTKAHEYVFLLAKQERYYYDAEAIREPFSEHTLVAYPYGPGGHQMKNGVPGQTPHRGMSNAMPNPAGRNKRTVWDVPTTPFSASSLGLHDIDHFAVMPPKLVEPCVLAGSSPKACPTCRAPWERMVERGAPPEPTHRHPAKRLEPGQAGNVGNGNMGFRASRLSGQEMMRWRALHPDTTLDWQPTCSCPHNDGSARCIVLDPFMGAGTTALVALQHKRHYLGVELNPQYVELIQRRISTVQPTLW